MKKNYALLLLISSISFGQVLSDDFNYSNSSLLTSNGWNAYSGLGTNSIAVGVSNGLFYSGYSGLTGFCASAEGNAAQLFNTGEDVNKSFATAVTSGSLYYSFLVNVSSAEANGGYFTLLGLGGISTSPWVSRIFVKNSATANKINFGASNTGIGTYGATNFDLGTTYLIIVKYDVSTRGTLSMWVKSTGIPASEASAGTPEITTSGSGAASVSAVYLRQYIAAQKITVDGIRIYSTWFGTAGCPLSLGAETATCDAITSNLDTYNVSVPFSGGGTGTYTLSTANIGTVGGDNPSTNATGNITISNIPEGTNVTLTTTGLCALSKIIISPECKPINALPFSDTFNYSAGSALGAQQNWANINTGDNIISASGSLTYYGITSTGNSISFSGSGAECFTPFTTTTNGTIYAAFLVNVSDMTNVTDLASSYFAYLTDNNKSILARLFVKRNGMQYQLGLDTASTTTNYDMTLRNIGDVVYVVIGYDFSTNSLNAWINPDNTNIGNPTLSIMPIIPFVNLGGFMLRQDSAITTPTIIFDEFKIVTTFPLLDFPLLTTPSPTSTPAPVSQAQTFCANATVANLTATGNVLKWYTALNGGSALATTTALATGTYYVSQTINTLESARTSVLVTVNPIPNSPIVATQNICGSVTVDNLVASGDTIKWYDTSISGTALSNTTTLNSGTYYVSQTVNGCESLKTAVSVNVIQQSITPIFTQIPSTCSGSTITALPTTSNNGITGTWSPAINNSETTTYTFTPDSAQCAATTTQTITITTPNVTSPISFTAPYRPNVTIGTQVWTSENLDVITYRDGTPIPQVTDETEWEALTTGAWCYNNNDPANEAIYGKLYNGYAVAGIHDNDPNTPNKTLAPIGWHIPSDSEWNNLINFLDPNANGGDNATNIAGGKLKSNTLWFSPNIGATNESGFSALPGSLRMADGIFINSNKFTYWWSSSENDAFPNTLWYRRIFSSSSSIRRAFYYKSAGFSVRLIKD